ncbi:MAG: hypothetical protein ACRC7P_08620 [Enterovibrio sp.]
MISAKLEIVGCSDADGGLKASQEKVRRHAVAIFAEVLDVPLERVDRHVRGASVAIEAVISAVLVAEKRPSPRAEEMVALIRSFVAAVHRKHPPLAPQAKAPSEPATDTTSEDCGALALAVSAQPEDSDAPPIHQEPIKITETSAAVTPLPDDFFPSWVREQYPDYANYRSVRGDLRITSFIEGLPDSVILENDNVRLVRFWDAARRLDKISLTQEELNAFKEYISDSDPMNMALIEKKSMTADVARMDRLLSGVFLKAKDIQVNEPVITYKGLRSKAKERFLGEIEVGSIVSPNYFFSTTTDEFLAKRNFLSIDTGCNKVLKIKGKSGLSLINKNLRIGWLEEQEVLYNKGTRFRITGVCDRDDGTKLIEMEEVEENQ